MIDLILELADQQHIIRKRRLMLWDAMLEARLDGIPFTPVYFYKGTLTVGDRK